MNISFPEFEPLTTDQSARHGSLCFMINRMDRGGAEQQMVSQINDLVRRHFDVYLITLFREKPGNTYQEELNLPKDRWLCADCHGRSDAWALLRIIRFLRRNEVDVIVSSLVLSNLLGRLAGLLLRTPVVIYEQNVAFQKGRITRLVDKLLQHVTTEIIAVSVAVNQSLVESGISANKISVIYNAVEARFFREHADSNGDIFLFLARLVPHKRADLVVEAFKEFSEGSVLIGGDGPCKKDLEMIAQGRRNIQFAGLITDPARFYARGSFFIIASLHEGFPLTLLEAMAAGCIPIVADTAVMREIIVDCQNGFIFPPHDSSGLIVVLRKALALSLNERLRLSSTAQASARKFSIKNHDEQLLDLLASSDVKPFNSLQRSY